MKNKINIFLVGLGFFITSPVFADDYIAVAKDGKIYDEANAKYVTLNQENEDVNVIPGMVFKAYEHTPGWYKIEYSPGLHAFIPEQIIATSYLNPSQGNYKVTNNPSESVTINFADGWSCTTKGESFKGIEKDGIVVFVDDQNNIIYSLVDFGSGPIVISYNNGVTKFF